MATRTALSGVDRVVAWAALASGSSATPSQPRPSQTRRRSSTLCSPIPAVKTSMSSPPSTAVSAPISRTMRRTYMSRARRARGEPASAASRSRGSAEIPDTPFRPDSWYRIRPTSSRLSRSISIR